MLRITTLTTANAAETLILEGKLVGPWVSTLREACQGKTPRLELSSVSFVDADGVQLLRDLLAGGATITSCSALVADLLHTEVA